MNPQKHHSNSPLQKRVLFSANAGGTIEVADLSRFNIQVDLSHRSLEAGVSRRRRLANAICDSWRVTHASRNYDTVVVSSAALESFVTALLWVAINPLRRLLRGNRANLVILDPILIRRTKLDFLFAFGIRRVASILYIRSGDLTTLVNRFHVDPARCQHVLMLAPNLDPQTVPEMRMNEVQQPYIYCAGESHRDWQLIIECLQLVDHTCIVATSKIDPRLTPIPEHVILMPAIEPATGHSIMRGAAMLLDVFLDTDRSCGPSVIVDALAMGLPVVTTDTNASRDYVVHGVTGLLSPPGDALQLAGNIKSILDDPGLREKMGNSARAFAATDLSRSTFESKLASIL